MAILFVLFVLASAETPNKAKTAQATRSIQTQTRTTSTIQTMNYSKNSEGVQSLWVENVVMSLALIKAAELLFAVLPLLMRLFLLCRRRGVPVAPLALQDSPRRQEPEAKKKNDDIEDEKCVGPSPEVLPVKFFTSPYGRRLHCSGKCHTIVHCPQLLLQEWDVCAYCVRKQEVYMQMKTKGSK
jgi:hypothetical protein